MTARAAKNVRVDETDPRGSRRRVTKEAVPRAASTGAAIRTVERKSGLNAASGAESRPGLGDGYAERVGQ